MANRTGKMKEVDCMFCGTPVNCDKDTRTVLCSNCCTRLADAPTPPKMVKRTVVDGEVVITKRAPGEKSGFPRGWHFKKNYVHTDGSVWSKGKLVTPAPTVEPKVENPDVPNEVTMDAPVSEAVLTE